MSFLTGQIKKDFLASCERIRNGSLHLKTPEGETYDFGSGQPQAVLEIHDWSMATATAARGDVGLGETYVAGLWDTPSIIDVITVALNNIDEFEGFTFPGFWSSLKFRIVDRLVRANSIAGASRNIRAHYDVGNEFFQLWLDPSMTYSSALFTADDKDLHRAQLRKYDRILERLPEGDRILEIGCGWGGFAERAADEGRKVTGITISPSQKGYADARLDGRADIRLQDYRLSEGKYDNIVSIEMIEAVGEKYWPSYFDTLKDSLSENGRAIIQAITVEDNFFGIYRKTSDYIRQYTFPGGMLLSNAVIAEQAKRAGLAVKESFSFGADYAATCKAWSDEFTRQSEKIHKLGHGDQFQRNWQYYFSVCSAAFAVGHTNVVQVELQHA